MFRLTIDMIFDLLIHLQPFQIAAKMKIKVQNSTKMSICHTTVNHRKICNAPLDDLMCPLQMINDIEPLSLTLNGVNACFIHHPSNLENYSISHKSETGEPKNKQKMDLWRIYFYTFILVLGTKFKISSGQKSSLNFFHIWEIGT